MNALIRGGSASPDETYVSSVLKAPRASGAVLRAMAALLERPLIGIGPASSILRRVGVERFRRLTFTEAPRYYPLVQPAEAGVPVATGPEPASLPGSAELETLGDRTRSAKEFRYPSIIDYYQAYREGNGTPVEIAERIIAVLENENLRGERPLYAFSAWNAAEIRLQAAESARRVAAGKPRSLLEGVPVAIKDELDVRGYPTTVGTAFLTDHAAESDAFVVRKLREAGAIILGKTNMHEIGIGVTGLNAAYGTPVNPYAPGRYPGGSSSGSGSAVAAGICPVAIGADGGGSVRIPAAYCGVFGLKMTWGRVSTTGEYPLARSVGNNGPLAGTARDLALAYLATAGEDPADPDTIGTPAPSLRGFTEDLTGVRVGVYPPWFEHGNEDVVSAAQALLEKFREVGAEIREIEIPGLDTLRVAHLLTITQEMRASMEEYLRAGSHRFGNEARTNLALARYLTTTDYIKAQQARARMISRLGELFRSVDVIATPATANLPPLLHGSRRLDGVSDILSTLETMRFTVLANMTGNPAVSVPARFIAPRGGGPADTTVPVALQCIGRHWEEPLLLRIARVAEELVERPSPQVYRSPLVIG